MELGRDEAASKPAGAEDYSYDLAHDAVREVSAAEQANQPADPIRVATESSDDGGDYGYDLAHDVPGASVESGEPTAR